MVSRAVFTFAITQELIPFGARETRGIAGKTVRVAFLSEGDLLSQVLFED